MNTLANECRVHAHALPAVKEFTSRIQMALKPAHFKRTRSVVGMSYEYASYLLHVRAGYVPPRPVDRDAVRDLEEVLAPRRDSHAA